jgi:predicted metal-dependent phosphotriesterase family hydrolase
MLDSGKIQSMKGLVPVEELGISLPHEHLFTDLRGPHVDDYAVADPADVVRVMVPYLYEAYQAGVPALKDHHVTDEIIQQITVSNPARAFSLG